MKDLQIWVDNILGRVTMYRLVIYGLSAIATFAFILMLTGYLSFSPVGFIVSIIVCVSASYTINRLVGWLFGLHPYSESAFITGLIIALLFTPPDFSLPTGIFVVMKLILVVTIANLSKYILAIRSKHVFNPAAIGIVIAGISGLAYASWWIGSPGLLPVTFIVAGLILYKTQKVQVGLAFLATSIIMIGLLAVSHGTFTVQNISLALTSWPLVFFAGIMLCEPLTMAPRRTQQVGIAILIGILLPLDFHYGKLSMTPALALVIGNAAAFWFSIQRTVKLRLVSNKKQGSDGHELTFDVTPFAYLPGQYIELTLQHRHADTRGMRRVFSIVGVPGDHQLSIAMRVPEKPSSFKKALMSLKPGKVIYGTRVAGDFVMPEDKNTPIVCIAGGVGITPFISFLEAGGARPITILYAVKNIHDLMFVDRLKQYNVTVVIVSKDEATLPDRDWIHKRESLSESVVSEYVTADSHVYISGPPAMVTNAKQFTKNAGALSVRTDSFTGY